MSRMTGAPVLACGRISVGTEANWDEIAARFAGLSHCTLGQGWRAHQDPALRPTVVRVGWDGADLLVLADLSDDDPFNPVVVYNEPSFQHGDVFEIFLRPVGQDPYYEFHVTPGNQTFQLRFPSAAAFAAVRAGGIAGDWKLAAPVMRSRTRVLAEQKRWLALARIPVATVSEHGAVGPGTKWLFSFSRYDYTRGADQPVLSSSSPHSRCDFHRQDEWGTLTFE